jgi:hypothetical protein
MTIDRPMPGCVYCGRAVRERWHLWCDVCYSKLVCESVNIECERLAIEKLRCEDGVLLCRDKSGKEYAFKGCHWVRSG